jgi:hypothetical protein
LTFVQSILQFLNPSHRLFLQRRLTPLYICMLSDTRIYILVEEILREQPAEIEKYDEPLVRRLVEKVTVYEDKFTVEFKSGVTVDVNE